ncbi:MAG TPA: universal stress protein [Burkholderiaceae bacterium]|nr:universal stress protein [Burkholderiaceae bacterium]
MYKTLLVPVDGRPRSARSIDVACRLAATFNAHVVGLFVKPLSDLPSALFAEGNATPLVEYQERRLRELTTAAKSQFDAGVKAAGNVSNEWRVADGDPADAVWLHARYADLVIINQTDPHAEDATHFADSVLLSLSRPALLVPYAGELKSLGRRALIAWNASRESARAVTDALPLLQRAERVRVLTIDGRPSAEGHGESPGADTALFLARHGVKAEAEQTVSGGVDVGNVILSRAADEAADLIVMGAYSHTRAREIVLGGATRTILSSMTVPVLMSH